MLTALMDITEAEAGVMKLNLEKTSIASLLTNVVELYELVAEEKRITLTTDFAAPCEAVVDATRMRQAFANLLDNALKYTPEGGNVRLACAVESGRVTVRVRDTGMGIPPDEQPRIWERLYRGDKSRSQRGLGLGLSLVKAIVEAHHGEVNLKKKKKRKKKFLEIDPELAYRNARRVVEDAARRGNFVRIDMEGRSVTQATIDVFQRLRSEFGIERRWHCCSLICIARWMTRASF